MSLAELVSTGFLQELNRQFLHPRGLALCVNGDEQTQKSWLSIWDYRDDLEGMIFSDETIQTPASIQKAKNVQAEFDKRAKTRRAMFVNETGIQPIRGFDDNDGQRQPATPVHR
jgi:hypothetical protein